MYACLVNLLKADLSENEGSTDTYTASIDPLLIPTTTLALASDSLNTYGVLMKPMIISVTAKVA